MLSSKLTIPTAQFVDLHFVDENYHAQHSQLLHKHEDVLELFYVMKGEGQYFVGGREYVVQSGSLVICNADVMHGEEPFQSHNMESYCCVMKDLSVFDLPPNTLTRPTSNPTLFFSDDRDAIEHILLALYQLHTAAADNHAVCNQLANAVLGLVFQKLCSRQQIHASSERTNEEFLQNILQYMDEHFMEQIQLSDLEERFHINQFYLSHIFKAETGLSPMKYMMYRRIGQSQNLLMNTSMLIGEISEALGFHDNCHFSATFKKYVGLTPSQYRQHFRPIAKK